MKVGFITCVHPIYNLPSVARHREEAAAGLRAAGCQVAVSALARNRDDIPCIVEEVKSAEVDLLVFFFCTWIAEEVTLSIAQELKEIPLLLWALPYFDLSIPMPSPMTGITSTGCNLQRAGRIFLHRIDAVTPETLQFTARLARLAAVARRLSRSRFGIFGAACPGMLDTSCDDAALQQALGADVQRFELDTLLQAAEASSQEEALELARKLQSQAGSCEVPLETLAEQYRLFLGMSDLLREHRLDGFSVRCWPELRDRRKTTICLTLTEMADRGIASACEADPTSLVTVFLLQQLSGQAACTLEITAYLRETAALQMAHCGSAALSLAAHPSCAHIRRHMRTGTGALLELALKPGPITLAKLMRPVEGRFQLFLARGEVIPTPDGTRGSVATIRVEPSMDAFLDAMLQHGVEHHLVLVYGDWIEDLRQIARLAGLATLEPPGAASLPRAT